MSSLFTASTFSFSEKLKWTEHELRISCCDVQHLELQKLWGAARTVRFTASINAVLETLVSFLCQMKQHLQPRWTLSWSQSFSPCDAPGEARGAEVGLKLLLTFLSGAPRRKRRCCVLWSEILQNQQVRASSSCSLKLSPPPPLCTVRIYAGTTPHSCPLTDPQTPRPSSTSSWSVRGASVVWSPPPNCSR